MKKRIILLMLALQCGLFAMAQQAMKTGGAEAVKRWEKDACRGYFGINIGPNNQNGLAGISFEQPFGNKFSIGIGTGISLWGWKSAVETRFYFGQDYRGWALGAGASYSTGIHHTRLKLKTIYGYDKVDIQYNPVTNIFFSGYYFWTMGKNTNRFYMELGLSVPVTKVSYDVKSSHILTEEADQGLISLSPGGIILGIGMYIH